LENAADAKEKSVNQIGHHFISPKLERAKEVDDPWIAFKLLREILTKPVFENLIETELSPPSDSAIPSGYTDLMRLSPSGFVTLNLDKFAGEALSEAHPGDLITPIIGKELARRWNEIRSARTFLVYLHGAIHDPSTWVMTQDELTVMLADAGHAHFLNTVFNDNLVLFSGMSADDVALSKRLLDLKNFGFQPRNLYWLTSRLDSNTEEWAESANISLIRYSTDKEISHSSIITSLVNDCLSFESLDAPEPPIVGSSDDLEINNDNIILDPDELAQRPPEEIRYSLSVILDKALKSSNSEADAFDAYRDFCNTYDYAVDRSFYRGKKEKFRKWFGYYLDESALGRGNFGEVYSAVGPSGDLVAVKIMHKNIFGNDEMLGGFRRGVRSMEIVTQNAVPGMVPILDSFELPPTIIMPYVQGLSLEDAVRSRPDMPWLTKLAIAVSIGKIVSRGHALPQTVLHRDLKPSNIMITNMEWDGSFDPDIVVLDFDMSWHKGSKEKDVVFESRDDFGYLAPEQTDAASRYAARSTRVDSYGFGMSLFFLFGVAAPRPNEALSDLWFVRATKAAGNGYDQSWQSAPIRLGRLIARATQIDQNSRVDFATMTHELEFISQALNDPTSLVNPDLWAEEVMASAASDFEYEWNDAIARGEFELPSGISVMSSANYRTASVDFQIGYIDNGMRERSSINKYLGGAIQGASKGLIDAGWNVSEKRMSAGEAFLLAHISISKISVNSLAPLAAANAAVRAFQF
jgi:serine/threonine protein kinase